MAKKNNANSNTSDNSLNEVSLIAIKQFYDKTADKVLRNVDTVFSADEKRADFLIKEGYAKLIEDTKSDDDSNVNDESDEDIKSNDESNENDKSDENPN